MEACAIPVRGYYLVGCRRDLFYERPGGRDVLPVGTLQDNRVVGVSSTEVDSTCVHEQDEGIVWEYPGLPLKGLL